MGTGFEDFEIVVERCPRSKSGSAWIWSVRHRTDSALLALGRSVGARAQACGEATLAVFQWLTVDHPASANDAAVENHRESGAQRESRAGV